MGKFSKSGGREMPELNTASMPDLVFAILFFFMVTTTMRSEELMVRLKLPSATEIQKLEKKSLVTYINIGPAMDPKYGTGTQMQLNDKFAQVEDIRIVAQEKSSLNEADQQPMTVSIKATKIPDYYISDVNKH